MRQKSSHGGARSCGGATSSRWAAKGCPVAKVTCGFERYRLSKGLAYGKRTVFAFSLWKAHFHCGKANGVPEDADRTTCLGFATTLGTYTVPERRWRWLGRRV